MTRTILLVILLAAASFAGGYFFDRALRHFSVVVECGVRI